jgi:hypothetical protein
MVQRPPALSAFEFVILAALRSGQLMRGCTPRVDGAHKTIMIAQLEVATGKVTRAHHDVRVVGSDPEPDSMASAPILVPVTDLVPELDVIASASTS